MSKTANYILLVLAVGALIVANTLFAPWNTEAQTGSKITDLTEDTSPTGDDIFVSVDDPSGTPVNKKVTRTNLLGTQTRSFALTPEATTSTDFLVWRTPFAITITNIHGVALSGTVNGGLEECDSTGSSCTVVDADIAMDGGLDSDDGSLTNPSIDAGDWIKWHTTSVSTPGFTTVTVYYTID